MKVLGKISPQIVKNKRMPQGLSELYTELFALADQLKPPVSYFRPFEGLWYRDCNLRLLLVGRAENEWELFKEKDAKSFVSKVNFLNKTGMNWLTPSGVSKKDFVNYKTGVSYQRDINKELFWRNGRTIFEFLMDGKAFWPPWFENLAWTNLFPLASCDRETVTEFQKEFQLDVAKKLLLQQLDFFAPTHVVFMTGWDGWFSRFSDCFPEVKRVEDKTGAVLAVGSYQEIKLAVTEHERELNQKEIGEQMFSPCH